MNTPKFEYVQRLRNQSAYPTYRFFVRLITIIFYVIGALRIFDSFVDFLTVEPSSFLKAIISLLIALIIGIMYIVIGKVAKEAMMMLADIADSITDINSRHDSQ